MEYFHVTHRDSESIKLDRDLSELKALIDSHTPSIIRGLLSAEEVEAVRNQCGEMSAGSEASNPTIEPGIPNFHRVDNNHPKSLVKGIYHGFMMFYWNEQTNRVAHLFKRLFRLRNLLSDLPEEYALNDMSDDGFISIPIVLHYPRGGGYMQEHKDPDVGQKLVISVCLSKHGEDFSTGGLYWVAPNGEQVWIDQFVEPGDALFFYPMDVHGIDPIDSDQELDWSRQDGRWMMMSSLVTLDSVRGKKGGMMAEGVGTIYEAGGIAS